MSRQPEKPRAYLQIALMFFIIVATILLGFLMMPSSQEERDQLLESLGTTNHGTLLVPVRPLSELALTDNTGQVWRWPAQKPRWRMLIPAGADCEGECAELLRTTRQVHIRLGKYTGRLERVLVATDRLAPGLEESLASEHPYLKILHADAEQFAGWLAETNSPWRPGEAQVVLVDPAGIAMMTYDASHNGNGMLEDVNHLLKYSAD